MDERGSVISNIAEWCAVQILNGYEEYLEEFTTITRKAGSRFRSRDWVKAHSDNLERLDLYPDVVRKIVTFMQTTLGEKLTMSELGPAMKETFSGLVSGRDDFELAETFFNSVIRKFFFIINSTPGMEYVPSDFDMPVIQDRPCPLCKAIIPPPGNTSSEDIFKELVLFYAPPLGIKYPDRDAAGISERVDSFLKETTGKSSFDMIEVIESVFYREKAAYVIGRLRNGEEIIPLAIAFLNSDDGVYADAVLLTEDEVSILFGVTRAYFHVEVSNPHEMINFLKTITPRKRVSEIYTSIGFHKHGKSELYRELMRSLENSDERFEIARGVMGMVMLVFTLPSFDVVFKLIKDSFDYPKNTYRDAVKNCYRLVFRHNRAGRLVDAQEFASLEFDISRFSEELLEQFRLRARESVTISGSRVKINHVYTERRLIPLDEYLKEVGETEAGNAIVDYGRCIKELATCNIFPGDLFLKNFGVTRHRRVVFYDYDEICLLTDCNFRRIPTPRNHFDEMAAEPWYYVGDHDVFPEEFETFLKLPPKLKKIFDKVHSELYDADFWKAVQDNINSGLIMHTFPYKQRRRFRKNEFL